MKTRFLLLVLISCGALSLLLLATYLPATARRPSVPAPEDVWPDAAAGGLYTSRRSDGVLSISNQGIFGPHICTAYGDPFSPLNSPWAPGYYTYTYRIRIPAGYPDDVIRVELFDPDSKNDQFNGNNLYQVFHTNLAQNSGGQPPSEFLSCGNNNQREPCLIDTGELSTPGATPDTINPYWFVRIDENRGAGTPPGNGTCGTPASYDPDFNTQTFYELYYYSEQNGSSPLKVPLAFYTGQTGDARDIRPDEDTDLRWVSPGAPLSFDQMVSVPTDCGSPNGGDYEPSTCPTGSAPGSGSGFEVSLSRDLPGIVTDPETGDRYLHLNVTTISGASENGFEIWAGPNSYTGSVPSNVNLRNVHILDNPGSHDAAGVTPLAVDYLPLNWNEDTRREAPLAYIGPEYAGQVISITMFDSDAGAAPPLHFYFDSISRNDWEVSFGPPGPHSCYPGSCNDQWVTPPFTITVPGDLSRCDFQNPIPEDCTPFYGGRLMADYDGGLHDTFVWGLEVPQAPAGNPTAGCAAFPLAGYEGARSVTPPGTGGNPYPDPADFDFPASPPAYAVFLDHVPDQPLVDAQEGTLYLYHQGFGMSEFGWLVWNSGIAASAATLENSLAWPGDTLDYTDHGDAGQPATPLYAHVVRGYVNPFNDADLALQIGDWIPAGTGSVNSAAIRAVLEGHVQQERTLRLPVWDQSDSQSAQYRTADFAIFRLIGGKLLATDTWLLLEFIRWDDSCGQSSGPITNLALTGPADGYVDTHYDFTAQVTPVTATTPITYHWQATGQAPVTHVGGLSDAVGYTWTSTGTKQITVTANDGQQQLQAFHAIAITTVPLVPVSEVILSGPAAGLTGQAQTFTAVSGPISATTPITYFWQATGQTTVTQTGGLTDQAAFTWVSWGMQTVTVTAVNAAGNPVGDVHTIAIDPYRLHLPIAVKPDS